jgi:hypothetical protein
VFVAFFNQFLIASLSLLNRGEREPNATCPGSGDSSFFDRGESFFLSMRSLSVAGDLCLSEGFRKGVESANLSSIRGDYGLGNACDIGLLFSVIKIT